MPSFTVKSLVLPALVVVACAPATSPATPEAPRKEVQSTITDTPDGPEGASINEQRFEDEVGDKTKVKFACVKGGMKVEGGQVILSKSGRDEWQEYRTDTYFLIDPGEYDVKLVIDGKETFMTSVTLYKGAITTVPLPAGQ